MTLDGLARHVLAGPDKGRMGVVLGTVKDLAIVDRGSPLANPSSPGGDPPVTRAPTMAPPGRFSCSHRRLLLHSGTQLAEPPAPPLCRGHLLVTCASPSSLCASHFDFQGNDVKRNKKQPRELAPCGADLYDVKFPYSRQYGSEERVWHDKRGGAADHRTKTQMRDALRPVRAT